jgi:hypothetical protein
MVLHLAEQLDVPLRERNNLLRSAGYADVYPERPLADPALETASVAVDLVLRGHEPYPALTVDRHWTLVARNGGVALLLEGVDLALLRPPVNVLRLSLHPAGLAPRIANFPEWRAHLLNRLQRQIDATLDVELGTLMDELRAYPAPTGSEAACPRAERDHGGVVVPLELITRSGVLALFSTTTIFGTPVDITLSELVLELFYPANAATTEVLLAQRT